MKDCIFCKIINKEVPADFIYENDKVVAFLDNGPINRGHVLIVPKTHHTDYLDTPEDIIAEMFTKVKKLAPGIMDAVGAQGFFVGINTKPAAGQVVFHTHLHIIPRFVDDGLKHWPHKQFSDEEMKNICSKIKEKLE